MIKILSILFMIFLCSSKVYRPSWQSEGQGAKVLRIIGSQIRRFDPFLMLDFFKSRLPAGFPDHPHRGFETVTYMISGKGYHQDFGGNFFAGGPGDVQWMTAGKGVVHAEVPGSWQEDIIGFQLWVNLDAKNKMMEPAYHNFKSDQFKIVKRQNSEVKILAGQYHGQIGLVNPKAKIAFYDIIIRDLGEVTISLPGNWNSLIYVFQGDVHYEGQLVQYEHSRILRKSKLDQKIDHKFTTSSKGRFILISGKPLNQPVKQHGPFVMNTDQQIQQAFRDYQNGRNGFEKARTWQSKIKLLMKGYKIEDIYPSAQL